ncbi:hypothetical protein [Nocardioides rotundus]|nr:hypothetical protein [Nocardioides rotundus]
MTTAEQSPTPATGVCESCDSLAVLTTVTDEDGQTWSVCPVCA